MLPSALVLVFSTLFPIFTTASQNPLKPSSKHPWIHKLASIGDSYAAGLGSGTRIDWSCSRYDQSYPALLHSSPYLGDDPNRTHQFLACSGADSAMTLDAQVPALDDDLDVLTISTGGNDIGLSAILNECIYQFFMAGKEKCEEAMNDAWAKINDENETYARFTKLIEAVKPKMGKNGVIYVTGYARFFGTEDELCDNVTWAVWSHESESSKQYLTLKRRKALNGMVLAVNSILSKAVQEAGSNVVFIDYDSHIAENRGRYCESSVQEPDPNRQGLYFYEWRTVDSEENRTELEQVGDDVRRGSFEGDTAEMVYKTLRERPECEFDPEKGFVDKGRVREEGIIGNTIHWMLPDGWKRVFHLRPKAHEIVAGLVLDAIKERSERINGGGVGDKGRDGAFLRSLEPSLRQAILKNPDDDKLQCCRTT
ncbi:SGNH hydrolase [Zopfia rhizophila CBS 207.26]|uniref:SGNH hydrolase n=1 Tax=Zopfia rhizophila CBS 207.26 TaxID=1314779 RepID=A0A6A6D528_9PEZI|nr:SGNH hydrolase [Zopfia rhizophila CBS 207.26]